MAMVAGEVAVQQAIKNGAFDFASATVYDNTLAAGTSYSDTALKSAYGGSSTVHRGFAERKAPNPGNGFVPLGLLTSLLVLLLFIGGGRFLHGLYDMITPDTKGIAFERAVIKPLAGSGVWGHIQNELHVDGPEGRHQVPFASVATLRTRPKPETRHWARSLSDRLDVEIVTTGGERIIGVTSRWIAYKYGDSAKYMDLLALKEIRSDSTCPVESCPEQSFTVRFEHLPFPVFKTAP
jgi:hypothetical protein